MLDYFYRHTKCQQGSTSGVLALYVGGYHQDQASELASDVSVKTQKFLKNWKVNFRLSSAYFPSCSCTQTHQTRCHPY